MRVGILRRLACYGDFLFAPASSVVHGPLRRAMLALTDGPDRTVLATARHHFRRNPRERRFRAMKHGVRSSVVGLFCFCLTAGGAAAANPVALVEEVDGAPAGVEAMTYLDQGSVIQLGAKDGLVIDYLASCEHEKITGGVVTIGMVSSKVVGGSVERQKVQCDGGQLALSSSQAAQGGVMVFRGVPKPSGRTEQPKVDRTLYGLCPLIALPGGGRLIVERLDQPGERTEIDIPNDKLLRGTFYDFAKESRNLTAGGIYRVSAGERSIVIRIDPKAQPGQAPLAGRLLRL